MLSSIKVCNVERFLCISVTFLDPLFHGKKEEDTPEWPPSPMRLFQALLAGSRAGCRNSRWSSDNQDPFRAAYCWLEQCEPPQILAPEASSTVGYTLFVPNNDSDKKFDRQDRLTSKVARPHRISIGGQVPDLRKRLYYLWPIPEEQWPTARRHAELICHEARHLLTLGWGIDQTVGNGSILTNTEAALLPGRRWWSWDNDRSGQIGWRVPKEGSLKDLEDVHESFLNRMNGHRFNPTRKLKQFDSVTYRSAATLPPRSCALFELPEGVAFRQETTNEIAAILRSLVCREKHRLDFQEQFSEDSEVYLAGHTGGGEQSPHRFSYLPLPSIGHPHADGMIRRLLIAEPISGDGFHAKWAQKRLKNQVLRDKYGNERGFLLDLWRQSSHVMVGRYISESRNWSSVTPVIVPGFDDGKHAKAEKLLLKAIWQAGLPIDVVTELTMRKAPFWPGSLHPRYYHRPRYLKHFPAWHVRLQFREPISGPLAIGAGRHVGLGLMVAWDGYCGGGDKRGQT